MPTREEMGKALWAAYYGAASPKDDDVIDKIWQRNYRPGQRQHWMHVAERFAAWLRKREETPREVCPVCGRNPCVQGMWRAPEPLPINSALVRGAIDRYRTVPIPKPICPCGATGLHNCPLPVAEEILRDLPGVPVITAFDDIRSVELRTYDSVNGKPRRGFVVTTIRFKCGCHVAWDHFNLTLGYSVSECDKSCEPAWEEYRELSKRRNARV